MSRGGVSQLRNCGRFVCGTCTCDEHVREESRTHAHARLSPMSVCHTRPLLLALRCQYRRRSRSAALSAPSSRRGRPIALLRVRGPPARTGPAARADDARRMRGAHRKCIFLKIVTGPASAGGPGPGETRRRPPRGVRRSVRHGVVPTNGSGRVGSRVGGPEPGPMGECIGFTVV